MSQNYWNQPVETLPRDELQDLQLERLQMTLNRAYTKVDFYRQRFDQANLLPEDVQSLEDLRKLPFTTREDLAAYYPYGLFSVPLSSIVRLKLPASLHGRPMVIGYTQRDVQNWTELMARHMTAVGIRVKDIVQVAFNYGLFPGAFTFNQGTELIGATLAPTSIVSATLQLQIMQDFHCTVLATTPSFALHILEIMESQALNPDQLYLKIGFFGPETMTPAVRERLEKSFHLQAYAIYGVNEMVEPGVAGECREKRGLHLAEDHFFAEIIDPRSGEPVAAGEEGELVITTLTNEGYPLIRYRTSDLTALESSPCPCGRTLARISPPLRRTDGLVMVRGIGIYPLQVEGLLREIAPGVEDFRLLIKKRYGLGDQLEIQMGLPRQLFENDRQAAALADTLRAHLRRGLGLGVKVKLLETSKLPTALDAGKVIYEGEPSEGPREMLW